MNAPNLVTIEHWRQAYLAGASAHGLLGALRDHLAARKSGPAGDPVWIHLASPDEMAQQLAALQARVDALPPGTDTAGRAKALPLYGVPFAVKDNIDVAGVPTTAACPAWSHPAERSARVVELLVAAGAVWLGKTNLDQFATGLVGTRSPYGRPASVFAANRVSGGSSSGSAVAVARGDVPFSLGTDTAGSGRVPAGFNHLVGLKPTPGRVSTAGVLPACRSLDCVSVFAHTADDAASVLALIEGPDAADAFSAISAYSPGPARLPARLRVGVPMAPRFHGDVAYAPAWQAACAALEAQGHVAVPLDFAPLHAVAQLLYDGPWVAERHAVVRQLLARDPDALDPQVRHIVESAARFSATDGFLGHYKLREAQRDTAAVWQQVDVLMVPTAPGHPLTAAVLADPLAENALLGIYTNFVNLLGWCALALPAGFVESSGLPLALPFGVTFIAPGGADAALARFGASWQAALDLPLAPKAAGPSITPSAVPLKLTDLPAPTQPMKPPATEPVLPIAVVGAHLSGLPLNGQLIERGAHLIEATTTAPRYRLHALPGTVPPKPGLVRVAAEDAAPGHALGHATGHATGHAIAVEVWAVPQRHVGSFLALIPPPLGLGSIELADGRWVHGFLCEASALHGAPDVSGFGGWRAYLASRG